MTSDFPPELWDYVFRPPPAWPWSVEPDHQTAPERLDLRTLRFARTIATSFVFLEELGFAMTPPDAWELRDTAHTVGWERADMELLASLADDGSFWVTTFPRAETVDGMPIDDRLRSLIGADQPVVTFGSFPVLPRGADDLAGRLAPYRDAVRAAAREILGSQPVDFALLADAFDHALEALRRPRLVAHYETRAARAWADARYDAYIESIENLAELGAAPPDPARLAFAEAHRPAGPTLGADTIDEAERIRRGAAMLDRAKAGLNEAAGRRDGSDAASAAWEDAAIAFHRAMALLYSDEFWERIGAIGDGEEGPVEDALTFLQVDPWCFRSGYAKETILHRLKRVTFTEEHAARLRAIVLHAIDAGDRREFRGYCRLARHVADRAFRGAVLARLRSEDRGVARRALWVLDAIAEPLGPDDRAVAQQILETGARGTTEDWWRVARWVPVLAARYADPTWAARVVRLAIDDGPDQVAGLRLLPALPNDLSGPDRQVLAALVLRVIDDGGDESFLESTAVLADSPAFRDALSDVYESAVDREVRRRAWWAINAIRRFADGGWPEYERET